MDRLKRQLIREMKANPAKAAVLGALLAVALWFWFPLMKKWIYKPEPSPPPTLAGVAANPAPSPMAMPKRNWKDVANEFDTDPLRVAHAAPRAIPNPFRKTIDPETEETIETEEVVDEELTADDLGLTVTSTITGGRTRVALINGRAFREGENVKVNVDGDVYNFRLALVGSSGVLLEGDGKRFELKLQSDRTGAPMGASL